MLGDPEHGENGYQKWWRHETNSTRIIAATAILIQIQKHETSFVMVIAKIVVGNEKILVSPNSLNCKLITDDTLPNGEIIYLRF